MWVIVWLFCCVCINLRIIVVNVFPLCLLSACSVVAQTNMGQCVFGFLQADSFNTTSYNNGSLDEVEPTTENGIQVIAPGLKFDCEGRINKWDALLTITSALFIGTAFAYNLKFQVWRPSSTVDGGFDLVGSNSYTIKILDATEITVIGDTIIFTNFPGLEVAEDERIHFQPGDVLGWYSKVLGFDPGFGVAVEKNGSSSNVFSMFSAGETCQFYTCNETIQHHTSALPLIRVEIGELIFVVCQYITHSCLTVAVFDS